GFAPHRRASPLRILGVATLLLLLPRGSFFHLRFFHMTCTRVAPPAQHPLRPSRAHPTQAPRQGARAIFLPTRAHPRAGAQPHAGSSSPPSSIGHGTSTFKNHRSHRRCRRHRLEQRFARTHGRPTHRSHRRRRRTEHGARLDLGRAAV